MGTMTLAEYLRLQRKPADPRRVAGGRRAKSAGDEWEAIIESSCVGVLVLEPIPNGARFVGGGKWVPIKAPFDYCGALPSGRGIYFDAKSLGDDHASFPLGDPKIVHPHQAAALHRLSTQTRAIAGLLVRCGRMNDYRWLDGRHLRPQIRLGWNDARWLVLGRGVGPVPMRRLVEHYERG